MYRWNESAIGVNSVIRFEIEGLNRKIKVIFIGTRYFMVTLREFSPTSFRGMALLSSLHLGL